MTEREYVAKCEGFKLKRAMDLENVRWNMWASLNSMRDKDSFIRQPKDIIRIPLIDGPEITMSKSDIKAMFEKMTPK
jgi:hypothetical protein